MSHKDKDICALLEALAQDLEEVGNSAGALICKNAGERITALNRTLAYYYEQDAAKAD